MPLNQSEYSTDLALASGSDSISSTSCCATFMVASSMAVVRGEILLDFSESGFRVNRSNGTHGLP